MTQENANADMKEVWRRLSASNFSEMNPTTGEFMRLWPMRDTRESKNQLVFRDSAMQGCKL